MSDNKREQERTELYRTIWALANELRGSVDGWDFKQYVLGIFNSSSGVWEILTVLIFLLFDKSICFILKTEFIYTPSKFWHPEKSILFKYG